MPSTPSAYPEFDASELSVEIARSTLEAHNCLLIRRLARPELVDMLLQRTMQVFSTRQQMVEQGDVPLSTPVSAPGHDRQDMVFSLRVPELDMPGGPPNQMLALFRGSLLHPLLQELLGTPVYFNVAESYVRKVMANRRETLMPYHQDGQYQVHHHAPYINCWIPLVSCGTDAPGLEILPSNLKTLLLIDEGFISRPLRKEMQLESGSTAELHADSFFDTEGYVEKYADKLWRPVMEPGDVLLLNTFGIHRTNAQPQMHKPRFSIEMRFSAGPQIPEQVRSHYGFIPI